MSVVYDAYVIQGGQANCGLCNKPLQEGDGYCRVILNSYAKPYFHAFCLIEAGKKAKKHHGLTSKKKAAIAKKKAQTAKKRDDLNWRKNIIREALKEAKVTYQDYSLSGSTRTPSIRITLKHSRTYPYAYVTFKENGVVGYYAPGRVTRSTKQCELSLADPNSLKTIGQMIAKDVAD